MSPAFRAAHSCSWWDTTTAGDAVLQASGFFWVYLVVPSSDGWAALELRGPCRDVLGTQAQVVMGRLHRQRGSGLLRLLDQVQRLHRGQVDDVAPHPAAETPRLETRKPQAEVVGTPLLLVLQAELCDQANSLHLHDIRPGLQERGVVARVCVDGAHSL